MRVGLAAPCEGADDGGVPQRAAVGDDLNAPFVRDRQHPGSCPQAGRGDPGAGLATDARDGMLKGQRARGEDIRSSTG